MKIKKYVRVADADDLAIGELFILDENEEVGADDLAIGELFILDENEEVCEGGADDGDEEVPVHHEEAKGREAFLLPDHVHS